jgi:signal transduction histidine kinase
VWRDHPLAVDVALAVAATAFTLVSLLVTQWTNDALDLTGGPSLGWSVVATVALGVPFALRRVRPAIGIVGVTAVFAVYRITEVPELTGSTIVYFVALASAGVHLTPPWRFRLRLASVLTMVAVYVESLLTVDAPDELDHLLTASIGFNLAFNVVFFVVAWVLGDTVRLRLERERQLVETARQLEQDRAEQARRAVVDERLRIARELHDVVAHHVSVMGVQAGAARRVLAHDPEAAVGALATIEESSRQGVDELRRLVGLLRADDQVESLAPQPGLARLHELVDEARRGGLDVTASVLGDVRPVPASIEVSMFRIVQEALTNTRKHADASAAAVEVRYLPDAVQVEVVDDGRGPAPSGASTGNGTGHGLLGMRERVGLHGGRLDVGPVPAGGYRVLATFPVRAS